MSSLFATSQMTAIAAAGSSRSNFACCWQSVPKPVPSWTKRITKSSFSNFSFQPSNSACIFEQ